MAPPILNYASPPAASPVRRTKHYVSGPFMFAQSLNFAIGFFIYFWVMNTNGFARLLSCPIAVLIGAIQLFTFTLSGWTTILTRSTLPWWAKAIGVIAVTIGSALSVLSCFVGFATAHGC